MSAVNGYAAAGPPAQYFDLSKQDPRVRRSDDWDFPLNKFGNVGWLGRVHRGTPWQTIYLKAQAVPEDTWIDWDAEARRFVTVDEKHPDGITARTRTVVRYEDDYLEHRWHDGSRVSLADVVLPWILVFDRADEKSRLYDRAYAPTFEVFQRHFRGWRIVAREPLTIEIYADQIYPDAEWIVASRAPTVAAARGMAAKATRRAPRRWRSGSSPWGSSAACRPDRPSFHISSAVTSGTSPSSTACLRTWNAASNSSPRDGDAVFSAFKLSLQIPKVGVGLQVRITLHHHQQARQRRR